MYRNKDKPPTCWICGRTEAEINAEFDTLQPALKEITSIGISWSGLYVCEVCLNVLVVTLIDNDFAMKDDVEEVFSDLLPDLTISYKQETDA